ncbi:MAG: hypothetical protein JWN70_974 [Planctomycetaceae bacterium]|nr:hypothetical protein [Planctomycetaceae bacterium]
MAASDSTAKVLHRASVVWIAFAGVALSIGLIGCGPAADAKYTVTGTVTFDDQPVKQGMLIFYPTDTGADADVTPIRDGRFELQMKAGPKKVEITANREIVPKKIGPMGGPEMEQYIPAKYNSKTELKSQVEKKAKNEIKFELKSK